jgi:hypothetical protein
MKTSVRDAWRQQVAQNGAGREQVPLPLPPQLLLQTKDGMVAPRSRRRRGRSALGRDESQERGQVSEKGDHQCVVMVRNAREI